MGSPSNPVWIIKWPFPCLAPTFFLGATVRGESDIIGTLLRRGVREIEDGNDAPLMRDARAFALTNPCFEPLLLAENELLGFLDLTHADADEPTDGDRIEVGLITQCSSSVKTPM